MKVTSPPETGARSRRRHRFMTALASAGATSTGRRVPAVQRGGGGAPAPFFPPLRSMEKPDAPCSLDRTRRFRSGSR